MEKMNYDQVDHLWKNMNLGLIPDEEIRRLMKIVIEKRIEWGSRPTQQQQLAQLLDFTKYIYETPKSFTHIIHGDTLKESAATTLEEACVSTMDLYCEKARIKDGQTILDLGCGAGSLVFHVAKKFKNCKVTGLNLSNVEIVLVDVTSLEMQSTFDHVFVIGLIENFELFLRKVSKWMKDDRLLLLEHYFHKKNSYHWEGTLLMPSATCLMYFQDDVTVLDHWILSVNHFSRSQCKLLCLKNYFVFYINEWLKRIDSRVEEIKEIFESFYGISKEEDGKLVNFWRIFCITGTELFGYNNGEEWSISHILFKKK
ncbi:hypothetical protein MKX03_020304 [Papaver bracteatum]|nr:hypothetical protein MKX03_020304 [Papaver bracteatum]